MTYYTLNRTIGDWNTWYIGGIKNPKWSNEFPDAYQFKTQRDAEGTLNRLKGLHGLQLGDASVSKET